MHKFLADPPESLAYSLAQAARVSGLGKRTLEAHAASGRLRTRLIGGRRIVLRRDLLAFLNRDQPFAAPSKRTKVDSQSGGPSQ